MCTLVSVSTLLNLQDHAFAENPLEREYDEVEMKPEDVKSLQELYQLMRESGFEGLESKRIPVPEDRAPPEFCFDMMTGINKFFFLNLFTFTYLDIYFRYSEVRARQRALHLLRPAGAGPHQPGHGDSLPHQGDADHHRAQVRPAQQTAFIMPVANNFGKVLGLRTKVFEIITKTLTMNVEEPRIPFKQL